jgi:hypothetical protein
MMKAHGIHQSQITPRELSVKSTPRAKSTKPRATGKKRKSPESDSGDEEELASTPKGGESDFPTPSPTPSKKVKKAKKETVEKPVSEFVPINKVKGEVKEEVKEVGEVEGVGEAKKVKEEPDTGIKEEIAAVA